MSEPSPSNALDFDEYFRQLRRCREHRLSLEEHISRRQCFDACHERARMERWRDPHDLEFELVYTRLIEAWYAFVLLEAEEEARRSGAVALVEAPQQE